MAATRVTLRIKAIVHIEFIQKPSMLSLQGSRNEQGYQLKNDGSDKGDQSD